ncbi:diguanylate cyclase [Caldisalinibacter kiritimatiensis]|uniref:Response regulator/GGDEF domain protein n=1 Tax=Caldisalinibacter kiritimatiensis TaxID=1304284 RepID=R1CFN7_9FIRM|nr:diguanylate cyclase [Caldisalinibacter kiritimatiensis]EOD01120.1 response regulator/GGDEF domain protein [Caldisalinibacter kiritimatiensis]
MLYAFLNNMTVIISFMFVSIKIKYFIYSKITTKKFIRWMSPLTFGLLCILIMFYPFEYHGTYFDLRDVGIFIISYIAGCKFASLTIILPILYKLQLNVSNVQIDILLGIVLPAIIGSYFHDPNETNNIFPKLNIKRLIKSYLSFQLIHKLLLLSLDFHFLSWLRISGLMIVFSTISIVSIALMINDTSNNIILQKNLRYLCNHDYLTKLPNIRYFKSEVKKILDMGIPIAIAMIDIDHFKSYNDTYGHPAGDEVLKNLAIILREQTRNSDNRYKDYVARYGGEEFIVCFTDISDIDTMYNLGERIRKDVENYHFIGEETQPGGNLTISVGLSYSTKDKILDKIIEEADEALYISKETGRNKTTIYQK